MHTISAPSETVVRCSACLLPDNCSSKGLWRGTGSLLHCSIDRECIWWVILIFWAELWSSHLRPQNHMPLSHSYVTRTQVRMGEGNCGYWLPGLWCWVLCGFLTALFCRPLELCSLPTTHHSGLRCLGSVLFLELNRSKLESFKQNFKEILRKNNDELNGIMNCRVYVIKIK